jgi:hypothetical protein
LHEWIDEGKGVDHRQKRHFYTRKYQDYIYKNFGGHEAVSEWLFHIALDNLDTSIKNDKMHNLSKINLHKFGFEENGYIHYMEKIVVDFKKEFCN